MSGPYRVKTKTFEGPFGLLLDLIEQRKLHINDISLAAVTDDFLAYLEQQKAPLSESASFILVASTLLLIKSKSLLPALELTHEEQGDVKNLEARLKLYAFFKRLAPHVAENFGTNILFPRLLLWEAVPIFSPDKSCSTPYLYATIEAVVANLPRKKASPQAIVERVISLEQMIEQLSVRIAKTLSLSFRDFSGAKGVAGKGTSKIKVIVGFLAMLELVKRGVVNARQELQFGDITMEAEKVGTPRYT